MNLVRKSYENCLCMDIVGGKRIGEIFDMGKVVEETIKGIAILGIFKLA